MSLTRQTRQTGDNTRSGLWFSIMVLAWLLAGCISSTAATNCVCSTAGDGAILTPSWSCSWADVRSFLVSAWVNPSISTSSEDRVVVERAVLVPSGNPMGYPPGIRLNFRLGLDTVGRPFVSYHGMGYDPILEEAKATAPLEAGLWHHLAGQHNGFDQELRVFLNGDLVGMKPTSEIPFNGWFGGPEPPFPPPEPGTVTIGAGNNDPTGATTNVSRFFAGKIDEVIVWDSAMDAARVNADMRTKPLGTESNLVGYWSFDDGTGVDACTNALDGAFHNSTSSAERVTFPATVGIGVSGSVELKFDTIQDGMYAAEWNTNLIATNWVSVATNVDGTGGDVLVTDTNTTGSIRFYRVISLP